MKILFYQTAFIGDLFLGVPLLQRVRQLWPQSTILIACRKGPGSLFKDLGYADEVFEVDKNLAPSYSLFLKELKKHHYDIILCPHRSLRTHYYMMKLKAKVKIGYDQIWNRFVFDKVVPRFLDWPEPLRLLCLLSPLDVDLNRRFEEWRAQKKYFNLTELKAVSHWQEQIPEEFIIDPLLFKKSFDEVAQILSVNKKSHYYEVFQSAKQDRWVCLAPGSAWNTKKWGSDRYAELAHKLIRDGYKVILIGDKRDIITAAAVQNSLAKKYPEQAQCLINVTGETTLSDICLILKKSQFLIANDSAPIHIASLTQTPTIAIFGPTTLSLGYRPWNNISQIAQIELSCRPCGLHGHKKCPIGTHDCMKKLDVDKVYALSKAYF